MPPVECATIITLEIPRDAQSMGVGRELVEG
jgi:hypothetical protein